MDIQVIRSKRRTVSLEVRTDLSVVLRVPNRLPKREINRIIDEKQDWIEEYLVKMKQKVLDDTEDINYFTPEEIKSMADQALKVIPERVAHFAPIVGVDYGRITIRNQKTRWGSCSGKGNLNFNLLLMATNPDVIDYVVVHELCHRLEMNHSKKFWAEVERVLPDYKTSKKYLSDNGSKIMKRMFRA